MSPCENVHRRGAVYWWRKKVACGEPPVAMTIALSFRVREPARARTMAALLNARFLGLGDMMLTGRATLDQARAILAAMIRDEIKLREEGAFRALIGPRLSILIGAKTRGKASSATNARSAALTASSPNMATT